MTVQVYAEHRRGTRGVVLGVGIGIGLPGAGSSVDGFTIGRR
jgi:hypothetical protein